MAIASVQAGIAATGTASPAVIKMPASGVVDGDLLHFQVSVHTSTSSPTLATPAGWTIVDSAVKTNLNVTIITATYVRVASGDSGLTYNVTITGTVVAWETDGNEYSGVDTTGAIPGVDVHGSLTGSSSLATTPSVTTTRANDFILSTYGFAGSSAILLPAAITSRYTANATGIAIGMGDELQTAAGATTARTASGSNAPWTAFATAIKASIPPSGGLPLTLYAHRKLILQKKFTYLPRRHKGWVYQLPWLNLTPPAILIHQKHKRTLVRKPPHKHLFAILHLPWMNPQTPSLPTTILTHQKGHRVNIQRVLKPPYKHLFALLHLPWMNPQTPSTPPSVLTRQKSHRASIQKSRSVQRHRGRTQGFPTPIEPPFLRAHPHRQAQPKLLPRPRRRSVKLLGLPLPLLPISFFPPFLLTHRRRQAQPKLPLRSHRRSIKLLGLPFPSFFPLFLSVRRARPTRIRPFQSRRRRFGRLQGFPTPIEPPFLYARPRRSNPRAKTAQPRKRSRTAIFFAWISAPAVAVVEAIVLWRKRHGY